LFRFAKGSVLPRMRAPIDLLLVEDVAAASMSLTGGAAYYAAAEAVKVLWRWCQETGMALVVSVSDAAAGKATRDEIYKLSQVAEIYHVVMGSHAPICDDTHTIYVAPDEVPAVASLIL
jgi:hypothetical protein